MLENIIMIVSILISLLGLAISFWSINKTRKDFYDDFLKKRNKVEK